MKIRTVLAAIMAVAVLSAFCTLHAMAVDLKVGDYVTLGQDRASNGMLYPIKWRVISVNENGSLVISDSVLSKVKEFDKEGKSGSHTRYTTGSINRENKGSNYW